jgi:hypothetical protein
MPCVRAFGMLKRCFPRIGIPLKNLGTSWGDFLTRVGRWGGRAADAGLSGASAAREGGHGWSGIYI